MCAVKQWGTAEPLSDELARWADSGEERICTILLCWDWWSRCYHSIAVRGMGYMMWCSLLLLGFHILQILGWNSRGMCLSWHMCRSYLPCLSMCFEKVIEGCHTLVVVNKTTYVWLFVSRRDIKLRRSSRERCCSCGQWCLCLPAPCSGWSSVPWYRTYKG